MHGGGHAELAEVGVQEGPPRLGWGLEPHSHGLLACRRASTWDTAEATQPSCLGLACPRLFTTEICNSLLKEF